MPFTGVADVMIKAYLSILMLFSSVFLSGCQDINSNSFDASKYRELPYDPNETNLNTRANAIINNRCTSCHDGYHDSFSAYNSKQDWINSGYITQGDADNSFMIGWMSNAGGTMPLGSGPIPNDEFQTLLDWINEPI